MKLRFTPKAIRDLGAIADYVRAHNPSAAVRVRDAILKSLQTLVLIPHAGRKQALESVRRFVTHRYPYIVYYSIDAKAGELVVLTIQHPAREPPLEGG